jgi:hypothetical protein
MQRGGFKSVGAGLTVSIVWNHHVLLHGRLNILNQDTIASSYRMTDTVSESGRTSSRFPSPNVSVRVTNPNTLLKRRLADRRRSNSIRDLAMPMCVQAVGVIRVVVIGSCSIHRPCCAERRLGRIERTGRPDVT